MSKIRFRAWLPSWQEMNYSHAPDDVDWFFNGEHFILSVFYDDRFAGQMQELEGVVIMQSTGLYDKNGVEIFEGDIVRVDDDYDMFGSLSGEKMKVTFNEGCFVLQNNYNPKAFHTFGDSLENMEVIGNIHENPELMEIKQ